MTWVDIANLRGPQGVQGPVNVGLRQTDPIEFAAPGGFTFNLADGGQQTVNLPLATAQSAGLQSPASAYDSEWRDITELFSNISSLGRAEVRRVADRLVYVIESMVVPGDGIVLAWSTLPSGFRPRNNRDVAVRGPSEEAQLTVNTGGGMVVNRATAGKQYSAFFTLDAPEQLPTALPGT
ncbi:hypothetical protein [Brevibacterium aurantiacum]|uniref:hypothetical protein n=1 Tax=Brevibacterium aurantiacum TaxID=273384 RepID=UPI003F8F7F02